MSLNGSREITDEELKKLREYFHRSYFRVDTDGRKEIVENTVRAYSDILTYLYIECQVLLGFRISEILSMKWSDVSDDKGGIKEMITLGKERMKGKKFSRTIYIPKSLRENLVIIRDILPYRYDPPKEIKLDDYIFVATGKNKTKPMHRDTMHKRLDYLFDRLHMKGKGKISSHSFRKLCFNTFYNICDKDIIRTASLTGHRRIDTLRHYLSSKIDDSQVQALMNR